MTTLILILAAVVLVLVLVVVMHQMCNSPLMWVCHMCCGTVTTLFGALCWCVAGAWEAATGSNG